ncbi:MAG: glycosyltransferase family 4 protein [Acidimicrobiales bacterium]
MAFIGQRGVPATFGGIEHHVEEIGTRLAARGHEVTVFCRTNYSPEPSARYRGMRLCHLPTVSSKHLDAIVHSGLSTLRALGAGFDIVHYHALGPGLLAPLPRYLSRSRVVLTVHGLDDERAKWGFAASAVLRTAGWMSARVPDATIVVSQALADHYAGAHGRTAFRIANGVDEPQPHPPKEITERFGLRKGGFVLFVGRLVPEKAPDLLIRAFSRLSGDVRLVIAGGSSFSDAYVERVARLAAADPRVLMTGYVYGPTLGELYANAAAFVLPSSLEGLPLTLLEAASHATPIVASSISPHLEVLGEDGPGHRLFPSGDEDALLSSLTRSMADPAAEQAGARDLRKEVLAAYSWTAAVDATEAVYRRVLRPHAAPA